MSCGKEPILSDYPFTAQEIANGENIMFGGESLKYNTIRYEKALATYKKCIESSGKSNVPNASNNLEKNPMFKKVTLGIVVFLVVVAIGGYYLGKIKK